MNRNDTIRAFLAVSLPPAIQDRLSELQKSFRACLPQIHWVKPENIHLTLRFLGNISPDFLTPLCESLRVLSGQTAPFTLTLRGIGVFPGWRAPRVVWVGLDGSLEPLRDLHDHIQVLLEPLGFPLEDKPFHPHATLARIKANWGQVGSVLKKETERWEGEEIGHFLVDRVVLYQSDLSPRGPTYKALGEIPFGKP